MISLRHSLAQTGKEVFFIAKSGLPKNCDLEIFAATGKGRSFSWSEKQCEQVSQATGGGVGIRVILNENGLAGKQGYAFSTSFLKESVEKSAQDALASARALPADEFRRLPFPEDFALHSNKVEERLTDPSLFSENVPAILDRLKAGEDQILKKYPLLKSVLRAGFSEGVSETLIINSKGIEKIFEGGHCGMGVSCLAEKDGERQEGGFGQSKRFKSDLNWESTFEKAAERTLALLGGKPIASVRAPVVFDPTVGSEFLSLISGSVCADSVQKGKSFLAGKLESVVASEQVTLIDDGTLEKGLATAPVDDEGVFTQKTVVVNKGKLNHFLYDTYTALKDRTISTGNAGRAGFKSSPSPSPTNFYLEAGSTPRQKLLSETCGLYLYEVMGLHMADPISGDFSVGAIGAWLENGKFKSAVRGVTLAGNLLELLKNLDVVCDDLTFFGSIGCPTFRVRELVVSGQ